jgi:hypothetical protein
MRYCIIARDLVMWTRRLDKCRKDYMKSNNHLAKKSSRADWGSNPRPMATCDSILVINCCWYGFPYSILSFQTGIRLIGTVRFH